MKNNNRITFIPASNSRNDADPLSLRSILPSCVLRRNKALKQLQAAKTHHLGEQRVLRKCSLCRGVVYDGVSAAMRAVMDRG
jgi:hypothetical protein